MACQPLLPVLRRRTLGVFACFSESIHGVFIILGKSIPWFLSTYRFLQVGVELVLLVLLTF
jgi:hypothetical protein